MALGRILIVDDDQVQLELVRGILEREGFQVVAASTGHEAVERARDSVDLVVLDVMLPDTDGLEVCRQIRRGSQVPILMLSTRAEDFHKAIGLEVGADDYLAKPFSAVELVARVRAMLRRSRMGGAEKPAEVIQQGDLRIDVSARRVDVAGKSVNLTPIEFSLLRALASSAGHVLSRQDLLSRAWGDDFFGVERTVDVHIRNLRMKLREAAPDREYINSVRGVGYRFG